MARAGRVGGRGGHGASHRTAVGLALEGPGQSTGSRQRPAPSVSASPSDRKPSSAAATAACPCDPMGASMASQASVLPGAQAGHDPAAQPAVRRFVGRRAAARRLERGQPARRTGSGTRTAADADSARPAANRHSAAERAGSAVRPRAAGRSWRRCPSARPSSRPDAPPARWRRPSPGGRAAGIALARVARAAVPRHDAAKDPPDVRVDRPDRPPERDGRHGSRRVRPDARQRLEGSQVVRDAPAVSLDDGPRGCAAG